MLKKRIAIIISLLLILQMSYTVVFAANTLSADYEDTLVIKNEDEGPVVTAEVIEDPENDTTTQINDDVYRIDKDVELVQPVSGNVYIIAENNVKVSSPTIYGNLVIVAKNVEIDAGTIITGSTYVASNHLEFDAITSDLYAVVAKNFKFGENAATYRDLKVAAGNSELNGNVLKNAYLSVEEEISCGKEFAVDGKLNYTSKKELNIPNELSIGEIIYTPKEDVEVKVNENQRSEFSKRLSGTISDVLIALLVAGLISLFRRDYFETEESDLTVAEQFKKIGVGILGIIVIPVIIIAILTTLIGWPIALVILSLYILMLVVAIPVAATKIASLIRIVTFREEKIIPLMLLTAAVAAVISLLDLIPFVGGLLMFLIYTFGFGTMILRLFRKRK